MNNIYKHKEMAYRAVFKGEDEKLKPLADDVMADLRIFCHATKQQFSSDPLQMARLVGRKEVFDRIMTFLKVDYEEYFNLNEEIFTND